MRLRRFLLRYYPPGITLEFEHSNGNTDSKTIDLLTLSPEYEHIFSPHFTFLTFRTDLDALTADIVRQEALISEARKPQVRKLLEKLVERMTCDRKQLFYLFKMLRAHILPLTNCAFNKSGDKYAVFQQED